MRIQPSNPVPFSDIEPCPICGRKPTIREDFWSINIWCKGHHYINEKKTAFESAEITRKRAIEKWNKDAEKIKKCIDVIGSVQHDNKTIYLLGDRTYKKKLLRSILERGHNIELI